MQRAKLVLRPPIPAAAWAGHEYNTRSAADNRTVLNGLIAAAIMPWIAKNQGRKPNTVVRYHPLKRGIPTTAISPAPTATPNTIRAMTPTPIPSPFWSSAIA